MPYKNILKQYSENEIYHTYARGINKMEIFKERSDYTYFLLLLKKYLDPKYERDLVERGVYTRPILSSSKEVRMFAYCLMNNHFHLLLKNKVDSGITSLFRKVLSTYSIYFNKKYKREGPVIQGGYRAVCIETEEQLIHTARYIHLNPLIFSRKGKVITRNYSSLENYIKGKGNGWLKINQVIQKSTEWEKLIKYSFERDCVESFE